MSYERYLEVFADARRAAHFYGLAEDWAEDATLDLLPKVPASANAGWWKLAIRRKAVRTLQRAQRHTDQFPMVHTAPIREVLWDIEGSLETLSPSTLAVLFLWLQGFQFREIESVSGIAANTARIQTVRAFRRCRRRLDG